MGQDKARQFRRKHIFAVNGSPDFLDFLRELLQGEQFNVTTTNFVPGTFDQIASARPDLLLVVVAIGRQAGWDLLEKIQQEAVTKKIPVVVTSTDPDLLDRAREAQVKYGGRRFLAKPFEIDELIDMIHEIIGQA